MTNSAPPSIPGRFRYGITLLWLNAGFYCGMLLVNALTLAAAVPAYCWLRFARKASRGTAVRYIIWCYGRAWSKLLTSFVPFSLQGCETLPSGPCIFVPNHQSFFDTYCFGFLPVKEIVFAVRAWPFRMPVYGTFMRAAEYPNTEALAAEALLAEGGRLLTRGVSVTVFPEGTRSPDGALSRFRSGAFHLAAATGMPVVPVCIDGTGRFLRKGGVLLRPSSITVRVLEPLCPGQFAHLGAEAPLAIRRAVKNRIRQTLAELRQGAPEAAPALCPKESV